MRLNSFKVLTFDVYGTLIDWESGMITALRPLVDKVSPKPDRDQVLESHARHESAMQRWTPTKLYRDLLPVVYRRLAEEWGVQVTWDECQAYGQTVVSWPPFADSTSALAYLKQHFKLAVLTNTDNLSFAGSQSHLGAAFDYVFTAEDIGSYKPDSRNFEYMLDYLGKFGFDSSEILHVAESQFHDHLPANDFGLANCRIYRRHDKQGHGATLPPSDTPTFDFQFDSMNELVGAHYRELSFVQ